MSGANGALRVARFNIKAEFTHANLQLLTLDYAPECMLLFMQTAALQIGERAKRTTLTVDAIRFYERRQLLPKAIRSTGGFRLYTTDAIERLQFIRQMHGLGFSLREIGELIDLRTRKIDACESVRQLLKHKVAEVRAKLHELQRLESALVADLQKCNKELKRRQRHAACACPVLEEVATK
jgi:DNA-binding transcriptional MerR regulator